jgi:hypothetical protein
MRVLSFGESLVNFSAKETKKRPQLATNTKRNTRKKREIQERKGEIQERKGEIQERNTFRERSQRNGLVDCIGLFVVAWRVVE